MVGSKTSDQAQKGLVEMGHEQLCLNWHSWMETSGQTWKGQVEAGDKWLCLNGHGWWAIRLKRTQSISSQANMVEVVLSVYVHEAKIDENSSYKLVKFSELTCCCLLTFVNILMWCFSHSGKTPMISMPAWEPWVQISWHTIHLIFFFSCCAQSIFESFFRSSHTYT